MQEYLADLQSILDDEIPMSSEMGMKVLQWDAEGLRVSMPLDRNRNHQGTAFAGSLNALCTIAGWGTTYLLLRELATEAGIVIRRSSVRYQVPVTTAEIVACCGPVNQADRDFFCEMLTQKGQAKLDVRVEIVIESKTAVAFSGSYVALKNGTSVFQFE